MYLLDTDILVFLARGKHNIQERVFQAGLSNCMLSEISLAELYVGIFKSGKTAFQTVVEYLEETFMALSISPYLKTYARIRSQLESRGIRLADMDLFIAATAIANEFTLVTHNVKHFARIPGLKLEDWTED